MAELKTDSNPAATTQGTNLAQLTAAADAGGRDAMLALARMHRRRNDVRTSGAVMATSMHWLQHAARAGHIDAMYDLGYTLSNTDRSAALRWFHCATRAGHRNLGFLAVVHPTPADV